MVLSLTLVVIVIVPLAVLTWGTVKLALRSDHRWRQVVIFSTVAALGVAAGYRLGFAFEYHVTDEFRIVGFPLPMIIFRLEGGYWTDYVSRAPLLIGLLNASMVALAAVAPLRLLFRLQKQPTEEEDKEQPAAGVAASP